MLRARWLCLFLILGTGNAWAYIPPTHFMIRTLTMKHAGFKGVKLRSLVTRLEGDQPAKEHFKVVTVLNGDLGILRSWASDDAGKTLFVLERKIDAPDLPLKAPFNAITLLLLDSQALRVTQALKKEGLPIRPPEEPRPVPSVFLDSKKSAEPSPLVAGVEPEKPEDTLSLGRWNKSIAWIIGSKPFTEKPEQQLWIEKETFFPLRLVLGPSEFQFEAYRYYREFPYPRIITVSEQKKSVMKDELSDLFVNPPDLNGFKKPVTPGFTDLGNAASSSVRDLIKYYYDYAK